VNDNPYTTHVGVAALGPAQRRHLDEQLLAEGINAVWLGDRVEVDQAYEARVESLVEASRTEVPPEAADASPFSVSPGAPAPYGAAPYAAANPYGAPGPGQRSPYPPTAYPGGPAYGPPTYPVGGFYVPQVTNQNATMALVFGLLTVAICGLCCIPAIIYGRKARAEIATSHGTQSGDGLALAGLIIGYIYAALIGVVIVGLLVLMVVGAFASSNPY